MNAAVRFAEATNRGDLDAIEAQFHPDFEMIVPSHPARGFKGRDQEVKNMRHLIATYPDARVEIRRMVERPGEVWTYSHLTATGLEMAAVVIFEIDEETDTIRRGTYFSDEVDRESPRIDDWLQGLGSKE